MSSIRDYTKWLWLTFPIDISTVDFYLTRNQLLFKLATGLKKASTKNDLYYFLMSIYFMTLFHNQFFKE